MDDTRESHPRLPKHRCWRPTTRGVELLGGCLMLCLIGCSTRVDYEPTNGEADNDQTVSGSPQTLDEAPAFEPAPTLLEGTASPPSEKPADESPPPVASDIEDPFEAKAPRQSLRDAAARTLSSPESDRETGRNPEPQTVATNALPDDLQDDELIGAGLFAGLPDPPAAADSAAEPNNASAESSAPETGGAEEKGFELPGPVELFFPSPNDAASASDEPTEEDPESGVADESQDLSSFDTPNRLDDTLPAPAIKQQVSDKPRAKQPTPPPVPEDLPAAPPAPAIVSSRSAAATPIRLDAANTRHLAWLLGAKATVLALAELGGVDDARQSQWQVDRLADMLGVSRPNNLSELAEGKTVGEIVAKLLDQSRTSAAELSRRHGADHAALMEIALKTNALLVLYERAPGLAGPVRRAVETAAEQAKLPEPVLAPLIIALNGEASANEVRVAVHSTHREIERLLREGS